MMNLYPSIVPQEPNNVPQLGRQEYDGTTASMKFLEISFEATLVN